MQNSAAGSRIRVSHLIINSPFTMKSKSFLRPVLMLLASVVAASVISSCHTVHGVGADVQSAGRGIQRTADRAAH
jgi:predicted small secreted protein